MKFTNILEDTLKTYVYSTDVPITVINDLGGETLCLGNKVVFCKYLKEYTEEKCPCSQTHLYASKQAEKIGEAYIFSCPAGLINFTTPFIESGNFKGAVIAGPFLMDFPDSIMVDEIIQKFHLNINVRRKIKSLLKAMLIIKPSKVRYLSKLLFIVVASLMGEEKNILIEKNNKYIQQARISESIQDLKNTSNKPFYLYEREKELLLKVKNRDIIGAKSILNDIIGHIFFSSGGNINVIKSRTLELCTLLSRAAVEGGADFNKVLGLNDSFLGELSKIQNLEDLSYWLLKILDSFTGNVFRDINDGNYSVIQKAAIYINDNYKSNLKLDIVANFVHLNLSYFSTLFKKEMGLSFSNYLDKIRINQSKFLLKNTNYSVKDIAFEVGFGDQSYFAKLFKNLTKMTPKEYKRKMLY